MKKKSLPKQKKKISNIWLKNCKKGGGGGRRERAGDWSTLKSEKIENQPKPSEN